MCIFRLPLVENAFPHFSHQYCSCPERDRGAFCNKLETRDIITRILELSYDYSYLNLSASKHTGGSDYVFLQLRKRIKKWLLYFVHTLAKWVWTSKALNEIIHARQRTSYNNTYEVHLVQLGHEHTFRRPATTPNISMHTIQQLYGCHFSHGFVVAVYWHVFLILWKQIKSLLTHIALEPVSSPYALACGISILFAEWKVFHNFHIYTWDLRAIACERCKGLFVRIPFYTFHSTTWNFLYEVQHVSLSCHCWKMTFHTFHTHMIYRFCSLFLWYSTRRRFETQKRRFENWTRFKKLDERWNKLVTHIKSRESFTKLYLSLATETEAVVMKPPFYVQQNAHNRSPNSVNWTSTW